MRLLPVKKFLYLVKLFIILALIVIFISFISLKVRQLTGIASILQNEDVDNSIFEKMIQDDEQRIVPGLGDLGKPVHLTGRESILGLNSENKLAMNVYLSDKIPYDRKIRDGRNPACASLKYDAELPSVSVVVIFHNEPYSVLIRTVWSVLNSVKRENPWFQMANFRNFASGEIMKMGYPGQNEADPYVYLKEIILVDDNSTLPELKEKMDYYIQTRMPQGMIKLIRLQERNGLIKARLQGARTARGDTLVFLDAHCEVFIDWLRPLLQRLKEKRDAALTPIIDVIDQTTFEIQTSDDFQVGGFNFGGHFTWVNVPEEEKLRRGSDISPTWSPTMAGGLFAINRNYFWEIGSYDEQMTGWGGENLEMSFRVWQCGGTLETIPCSRVGHVFRGFHPYGMPADSDTHGINTARMAEVWMDEYAELFYLHRPDLRANAKIGDVTHRKVLREKLHCKPFKWYLENIFKEKFVPIRDDTAFGRFRNPSTDLCLDNLQKEDPLSPLGVYTCHPTLMTSQFFSLTRFGELRTEELCAELQHFRNRNDIDVETTKAVVMVECHKKGRNQEWQHTPLGQIKHVRSKLCLDTSGVSSGQGLQASTCHEGRAGQIWKIDYKHGEAMDSLPDGQKRLMVANLEQKYAAYGELPLDDAVENLQKIIYSRKKRNRRAVTNPQRKKKRVNKFILRIQRVTPTGEDEHLEMDIYCKHRKLYPNNTFVKDLVHIFNDNNITVINNGRIFHKHRVFANFNKKDESEANTQNTMKNNREELYKRYSNGKQNNERVERYHDTPGFSGVEDIKINIGVGDKKHEMLRLKSSPNHEPLNRQDREDKRPDPKGKNKDVEMILQPMLTFSLKQQDKAKGSGGEETREKKGVNANSDPQNIDMLVKTNLTFIVSEDSSNSNRKAVVKKSKKQTLIPTRSVEDYSLDTEVKRKQKNIQIDENSGEAQDSNEE